MRGPRLCAMAAAAAVLSMLAISASAGTLRGKVGPELLTNGGFESGLTGWVATGFFAQNFDYGVDSQSHSGANAFFGGALGNPGFLSQAINTVQGRGYTVSLWLQSDGFLPNEFQILTNGNLRLDSTDLLIGPYNRVNLTFYATGATTTLQFGFRDDSGYLHLDDVSVSAAPEPASLALLGVGLAAAGFARRKRAKLAHAART